MIQGDRVWQRMRQGAGPFDSGFHHDKALQRPLQQGQPAVSGAAHEHGPNIRRHPGPIRQNFAARKLRIRQTAQA